MGLSARSVVSRVEPAMAQSGPLVLERKGG